MTSENLRETVRQLASNTDAGEVTPDNADVVVEALLQYVDFYDPDNDGDRAFARDNVATQLSLREVFEWRCEPFRRWDDNPGTGADAHAYFDAVESQGILDGILHEHSIGWHVKRSEDWRRTNKRERDGALILTLKRVE